MTDKEKLERWASRQTCPCGTYGLRVEWAMRAMPMGSFSLSGNQMKVSAFQVPILVCPGCGERAEGKRT